MSKLKLKAEARKELGRKVKALRKEGKLPANIYGSNIKSAAIKVDSKDFQTIRKEAGETKIIDLVLKGKNRPVLIHDVQVDPVSDSMLHVDFLQVDLKQKVTAQIPVELLGESPAEKQGLGTVVQYIDEIEVDALPTELPEKFEVNLSALESVDDQIQVKDIKVDKKKVEVKNDLEQTIARIEQMKEVEEEVKKEEVEGEVEGEAEVTEKTEEEKETKTVEEKE